MSADLTLREHQVVAEAYAAGRRDALLEARAGAMSLRRPSRDGGTLEEWLVVPVSHLWQIAAQGEERRPDPMDYDALRDLATEVHGRLLARKRAATDLAERARWLWQADALMAALRAVDPDDSQQVERLRAQLRRQHHRLTDMDED